METKERLLNARLLPHMFKIQKEAYGVYRTVQNFPQTLTSDSTFLTNPQFYEHKAYTPVITAIGIWQYLAETPWTVWKDSGSKQPVSVLFALINDYDDFLDEISIRTQHLTKQEVRRAWRLGRFRSDRPSFREMVSDFVHHLDQMNLPFRERNYILRKVVKFRNDFLNETFQYEYGNQDFSLDSARNLRENTCRPYGEVVGAVLNGRDCLTDIGLYVEKTLGNWFIAIQVAEDLIDIKEDLVSGNLSFFTGALRDHPEEESKILGLIRDGSKLHIRHFKRYAPHSYQDVEKTFHSYLDWFSTNKKTRLLRAYLSNAFYILAPIKDTLKIL